MSIFVVLILMFFAHIVDDYYLQGVLAKMKQRSWWESNAPDKQYRYDYIVALIFHAMSWSIMISLPILWAFAWQPHWVVYLLLPINIIIHAITDDLKANKKKINLIIDQSIHTAQILFTWLICMVVV